MGCYGIGPSRVMGSVVEIHHDDRGIIWPESIAPFKVHLLTLKNSDKIAEVAERLYVTLTEAGIEVLYDDRDESTGVKLNDCDLIGIPYRLIVSEKTISADSIELKKRSSDKVELIKIDEVLNNLD